MDLSGHRRLERRALLITPEADTPTHIPPVALDEMAFAMALFVGAADGRITRAHKEHLFSPDQSRSELSGAALGALTDALIDTEGSSDDIPLACGLSMVWHHYDGDRLQQPICSRLIAFYSMMVRSRGSVLSRGKLLPSADPESFFLEPSTIRAVATAPLNDAAQFEDASFKEVFNQVINLDRPKTTAPFVPTTGHAEMASHGKSPLALTSIVRELAKHLYIYEACAVSPLEPRGVLQFRVLEKFCGTFTTITGSQGLQLLLTRALATTSSEFPWLSNARVSSDGGLRGLEDLNDLPSLPEALHGELAMIGTLVELLRSLLGDDVTMHLLRTIWPLASLAQGSSE